MLLPSDDMLLTVYSDGILEAEPVHSKLEEIYLVRDQAIVEPYTSFEHETLNRIVHFVSRPSG